MEHLFWGGLSAALAVLALFAGLALLIWVDARGKTKERELAHAERLKALELGQPLPDADVARARASASQAWAGGLTATAVAIGMAGAATGATALVFASADSGIQLPLLCVI